MNTRQLLWRGLWMSALFWPYTHSGGFHDAAVLALTPFWLALGDLWSRWLLKSLTWAIALTAELVLEWSSWPGFRHIIGTFTRSVRVLHALSFAHWDQISAHIATPLLLLGALLGWFVYRQTRTPARIGILFILGIIAMVVNHVFWRLPASFPLFIYAAVGLMLLSSGTLQALRPLRTSYAGRAIAIIAIIFSLGLGWSLPPRPGHPTSSWLGANFHYLRLLSATGATTGFSSGINHIGHSVIPDYQPVMLVHSPYPYYWQAEIYNTFTGKEWTDASQNAIEITPEDSGIPLFNLPFTSSLVHTTTTNVTFQGLNGYKFHTLFYPGVPLTFQSPASLLLYPGKEQFTASNIATYHVTSVIPQFTTQELGSVFFGEYSQAALKEDLQVPRNLSPNVAKLAHQVTRDALGPWQAVSELKAYLDSHYRYSFVVTPSRTNVVNHFLFHDKEGYCDQFSSAFIMMARTLGIPARWVVGYAPGTYNAKKHGYVVRAIDAHSWAQVYIAPYGWVAIDPTPGFYMPGIVKSPPTTPQAQPTAQNPVVSLPKVHYTQIPAASSHHLTNAGQTSSRPHPLSPKHPRQWLWPLLLGGLGILAWVGAWAGQRRRHRFEPASLSAARLWHRVRRWSRWRLRLSSPTLTPREWARYWDSHPNATEAHELAQLLEHGLFSATGWDPREREKAWALWRQLRFVRHFKKATSQVS
ncbi:MAG: hypothetical protein C7B44_08650 [Sulfobacillus thermosulfidooxidans]|nr:MAG: hypothetical protein C7B44_08650 [Sulfobacillus thermosulfidooxidans]